MQESLVHKIGFVVVMSEGEQLKVLLAKTRPGQWRFPSAMLPVSLAQCDKDAAEPFRTQLNLGKTAYVNNVFFRDSHENGQVTRFFSLKCGTPDQALEEAARILDCPTRWASFEEASWVVAAEELEVSQWSERLVTPKASEQT